RLFARVVVCITTHSDDDSSHVFKSESVSLAPTKFSDLLWAIEMALLIQRASLFIFACSAIMKTENLIQLQKCMGRFDLKSVVAFTAVQLQPTWATGFLQAYGQKVLAESFNIYREFLVILHSADALRRHSGVILITSDDDKMSKFFWSNYASYPWGQPLPAQCGKCHFLHSWGKPVRGSNGAVALACQGKHKGQPCGATFSPEVVHGAKKVIDTGDHGQWMEEQEARGAQKPGGHHSKQSGRDKKGKGKAVWTRGEERAKRRKTKVSTRGADAGPSASSKQTSVKATTGPPRAKRDDAGPSAPGKAISVGAATGLSTVQEDLPDVSAVTHQKCLHRTITIHSFPIQTILARYIRLITACRHL
ncbi:hypothetical protein BV22DRAFT_1052753, partial [Leucogyrophana mollusca]